LWSEYGTPDEQINCTSAIDPKRNGILTPQSGLDGIKPHNDSHSITSAPCR